MKAWLEVFGRITNQLGLLRLAMDNAGKPIRQNQQYQDSFGPIHDATDTKPHSGSQIVLAWMEVAAFARRANAALKGLAQEKRSSSFPQP